VSVAAAASRVAGHWLDGAAVAEGGGATAPIEDPALGVEIRTVELADADLVGRAVDSAAATALEWGERPIASRIELLRAWTELIRAHSEEFVSVMGEEQGKVRADAQGEVMRGLEASELVYGTGLMLKGEISPQIATGVDVFSMRVPLGVCAVITPFNFPFMAPLGISSMALACGNAVILKPSERVPTASLMLGELASEAGIPAGVLNVVQGQREAVEAILDHPGIDAVTFIGSTDVGRAVYTRGTAAGKRVQTFGSAKNHMVVMPDADLEFTADSAVSAGFGSTGQRCMAVSVVAAVGDVADDLVAAIAERMAKVKMGPASDHGAEMGPLISKAAKERVIAAIDGAEAAGAKVVVDGRESGAEAGYFVAPTLLDEVTPELEVYQQEVFGPVLSVVRVDSLDDALALIAANRYGNGAAIFTRDGAAARAFQRGATAGMIGVNVPIPIPSSVYSFGGWKDSRLGDQHLAGTEGFRFFTRQKVVTSRWPEAQPSETNLAFPAR
jgi:malonate-semialdehyde dehydrogenase (acetylating)/methylmalonate-semialdehyde dehydrogenase